MKTVDLLARNLEKSFTINKIAKSLDEYYSLVHRTVQQLSRDGVLKKDRVGNSHICSLNLENEKALTLVKLSEIERREEFNSKNRELKLILEDFVKSLEPQHGRIVTIVLFGSYAKGTATKGSDLDILLVVSEKIGIDKITREIYSKYGKEIMPMVMTRTDFKSQKDKPVIKEIIENHYVLYGVENFVNMVL